MMHARYRFLFSCWLIVLIALIGSTQVIAQDANPETTPSVDEAQCPGLVQTALELTNRSCDETDSNEACYGHILLEAESRAQPDTFTFQQPGDIVDLLELQTLRLSAMNTVLGHWGVVLMAVEAKLQEDNAQTPSATDVQMLLFGDVALSDASRFVPVRATADLRIRQTPDTVSQVLGLLPASTQVIANGRLDDPPTWVRVRYDDAGSLGWVSAEFLESTLPLTTLEVVEPVADDAIDADNPARFGPMQAFTFQSGRSDAPCEEAPNSGVLIQTPEGVASVTIWMDEVIIQLDGTAFFQSQPNGDMTAYALDGTALIQANGETRTALPGTQVSVPMDENQVPTGGPSDPQPYDYSEVQALPTSLLDNAVTVPQPRDIQAGRPLDGQWRFTFGVDSLTCPDGTDVPFISTGVPGDLRNTDEGLTLSGAFYERQGQGVYSATYTDADGNLHQDTLQVIGPDRINGEKILDLAFPICTLNVPFTLQLVNED